MTTQTRFVTAEELFELGDIGRCELVDGEIIMMAPAGAEHGDIAGEIFGRIWTFVRQHGLGKVYAAETGFILSRNPDVTRAADVAFVRRERLPVGRMRGFFPGSPDLVVEVISPNEQARDVRAKVAQWLSAGAISVWLVNPQEKTLEAHHQTGPSLLYQGNADLCDDPAMPGFILKLQDLFDR